jgi:hypothetical protein
VVVAWRTKTAPRENTVAPAPRVIVSVVPPRPRAPPPYAPGEPPPYTAGGPPPYAETPPGL